MRKLKKQRGITLVALVITIIILLILAGISIAALTNQGLFEKAKDAKNKTELANAKEKMSLLLNEWQLEHATIADKTLEAFLNDKVTDNTIDEYKKLDDGNYEVYIKGYYGIISSEGKLIGEVEKAGPHPMISNITIKSEDGTTEVTDNSQKVGTKLQINFNASIQDGTVKVTPALPYITNGTETEVTFTIIGTVNNKEYKITKKISFENKYRESTPVKAADIANANNMSEYYGKNVTGYAPVNGSSVGWKIFYVDSNNIYLIADDYVELTKLPQSTNENEQLVGNPPTNTDNSWAKSAPLDNVIGNYSGSARINDALKPLNKLYFDKNFTSTNNNMKAVAYMLDTKAWSTFKDLEEKASYAIGGPTIEMLFKSYNQKHPGKNYEAQALNETGYQIRTNGGNWENYTTSESDYLDSTDELYVLPQSKGGNAMWLSSPSADYMDCVMGISYYGNVGFGGFSSNNIAFRPVICLDSNVRIQEYGEGYSILP